MTFKPYSKEQSIIKLRKGNLYACSDGSMLSDSQIKSKLSKAYKDYPLSRTCNCCWSEPATEHDHTISQKRCKELHKAELIWDSRNWSDSCRTCHGQWESYKSGEFSQHKNLLLRMYFLKKHDPEGHKKRLIYLERS